MTRIMLVEQYTLQNSTSCSLSHSIYFLPLTLKNLPQYLSFEKPHPESLSKHKGRSFTQIQTGKSTVPYFLLPMFLVSKLEDKFQHTMKSSIPRLQSTLISSRMIFSIITVLMKCPNNSTHSKVSLRIILLSLCPTFGSRHDHILLCFLTIYL
jgi:hypothetical protein